MNVTYRVQRIINNAVKEAEKTKDKIVRPVHLLIASLQENSGVLGEIQLRCRIKIECSEESRTRTEVCPYFSQPVTVEVVQVMEVAETYMRKYKQIYLNVGHLLKAFITTKVMDHYLSEEQKQIILQLGTTARDMITHLGTYEFPNLSSYNIRKVVRDDEPPLVAFVEQHYSTEWAHTIRTGFEKENPTIYIALNDEEKLIGFACFDTFQRKKGYFGPMGVFITNRMRGTGHALLHYCLRDMKEIGYEYAIIGGAGPIEFYEKACNAVIIPTKEKEK